MEKREFIGIDVSKPKLDVWFYEASKHKQFDNNQKGYESMLRWVEDCSLPDLVDR